MEANRTRRQSGSTALPAPAPRPELPTPEPSASFTDFLASLGLTLADIGHTPESMQAAERDFDARAAAAIADRRLRRSRRRLHLAGSAS
jgi:hypothetical protein